MRMQIRLSVVIRAAENASTHNLTPCTSRNKAHRTQAAPRDCPVPNALQDTTFGYCCFLSVVFTFSHRLLTSLDSPEILQQNQNVNHYYLVMRRLVVLVPSLSGVACEGKRFARKRGPSASTEPEMPPSFEQPGMDEQPAFDLSGLRTSRSMAAPPSTTSLDTIRSEISAMRREAQARAEGEKLREARRLAAEKATLAAKVHQMQKQNTAPQNTTTTDNEAEDALSSFLLASYRRLNKPSDSYFHGKEIEEGLQATDQITRKAFFNDVDEVVRPKNKAVTQQYMQMVFPHLTQPHAHSKLLGDLLEAIGTEHQKQLALVRKQQQQAAEGQLDGSDNGQNELDMNRVAWLNTLESLDEGQIRAMWQYGLLDTDVVENLVDDDDLDDYDDENGESEGEGGEAASSSTTATTTTLLLEERVEELKRLHAAQQITSTIRATALAGNPSLDIAPILQKAKHRQFEDITEKEVKQLESFEEGGGVDTAALRGRCAAGEHGHLLSQLRLTESLLERALNPSNRLLYAMAHKDDGLRESLDGLERIKRLTLLDPVFQEAVGFAHAVEEQSVDGYVRGVPSATAADRAKALFGHKAVTSHSNSSNGGAGRRGGAARGPMARPRHAADVPYFYNSARSVVPQRGSFNLPAPAMTKEEKAALRGMRKRSRGPTRFGR